MPTYEHQCEKCNHEWEDVYKMSDPIPDVCPNCEVKGHVKRLISWCAGTVILTGRENVIKHWNDGKKLAKEMNKNENKAANFIGEDKFHKNQLAVDKLK